MQLDLNNRPTETALLHRLVRDIVGTIEHRDGEIERLKSVIKQLRRAQFGRRSERLDPDQLALGFEDLEGDLAHVEERRPRVEKPPTEQPCRRKPLPDYLPREDVRLDIGDVTFPCCGGALHVIGESVSETLDWIPAQLRVVRTTRPKYACRACKTVVQAPAPERVIAGGLGRRRPFLRRKLSRSSSVRVTISCRAAAMPATNGAGEELAKLVNAGAASWAKRCEANFEWQIVICSKFSTPQRLRFMQTARR
jgi:hypothetical protein